MFADRRDAGRRLGRILEGQERADPIVLGIPRGGVIVAAEVARALGAPLDVLVVRKLGSPHNPELAMGAIGPDGTVVLDERVIEALGGVSPGVIEEAAEEQRVEIARRLERYRGDKPPLDVRSRHVIVVDDGIATGSTVRAALLWLRAHGAGSITLAVPVAPGQTVRTWESLADSFVCLIAPSMLDAVGAWYADFRQVSDDEVIDELSRQYAR